jgi:transcriptional regulator GlxA family with amidase domain
LAEQVVFVVYPDITLLDLVGPFQVLSGIQKKGADQPAYDVSIASKSGGSFAADQLMSVETAPPCAWRDKPIHTLIIVGGYGVYAAAEDVDFVEDVRCLAENAQRVCSVCTGAYLLAATGFLDDRRATTHWEHTERLKARFPKVKVETDPIYIKQDHVWTSAGVTAGIDMSLAIVAEDLGQDVALERARSFVAYMVRPGGQSQFSSALERQTVDQTGTFEQLHDWVARNLKSDLRIYRLAQQQNMSERSFYRAYVAHTGITPARMVENIRIDTARNLLETTALSVKSVAIRCGFKNDETMRRAFSRRIGVSPLEYRKRFKLH